MIYVLTTCQCIVFSWTPYRFYRYLQCLIFYLHKLGHHMLMKKQEDAEVDEEKEEYSETMRQNLNNDVEKLGARILQMKIKAPQTKEGISTTIFRTLCYNY